MLHSNRLPEHSEHLLGAIGQFCGGLRRWRLRVQSQRGLQKISNLQQRQAGGRIARPVDALSHVIWNSTGKFFKSKFRTITNAKFVDVPANTIICGSMGGEIQIRDLNTPDSLIKWRMSLYFGVESILHFELGQDHLLTWYLFF